MKRNQTVWSDHMDRISVIDELSHQIESLTRLNTLSLYPGRQHIQERKQSINNYIRNHRIEVRSELQPEIFYLYRRYFG